MTARSAANGTWRRHAVAVSLVVATVVGVTACTDADEAPRSGASSTVTEPRPLTAEEAQGLATMRFQNYAAGVRQVRLTVDEAGRTYSLTGWVDFTRHLGYAAIGTDEASDVALTAWTATGLASTVGEADDAGLPPLPPPTEGWQGAAIAPDRSRLHAVLALLPSLGSDRPDNPVLLQQSDARWLRADEVDGTPVQVVTGPSSDDLTAQDANADGARASVRYWVDDDWRALRVELRLGGAGQWVTIDLTDADDVDFADALTAGTSVADGAGA